VAQDLMQTTQPLFRLNPLSSDSQPTSASWIRWIGYGWKNARSSSSVRRLPTLHCTCYRIDAWAIRRPWLTFVNALANSILGCFYTARTQRFASWVWPMVLRKLGN